MAHLTVEQFAFFAYEGASSVVEEPTGKAYGDEIIEAVASLAERYPDRDSNSFDFFGEVQPEIGRLRREHCSHG